jgi:hypothetical protein
MRSARVAHPGPDRPRIRVRVFDTDMDMATQSAI